MSAVSFTIDALHLLGTILFSYLEVLYRLLVPSKRKSVAGRTVLITGAGHGMGRQMALSFAREKAVLVLWDINQANNEKTARDVRELDAEAFTYTVDCSSSNTVIESAKRVVEEVGSVYMLVNNAGVLVGEDLLNLTEQDITRTMNINVMAHFWTIRCFLPAMLESNDGHIVSIASLAGKQASHRLVDYCSSKYAAVGLHEALTDEINAVYRKPGVQTTVVCPSFVNTGLIHSVSTRMDGDEMLKTQAVVDQIMQGVLTNQLEVIIPKSANILLALKSLLPARGWRALYANLQVTVPSQTRRDN